MCIYPTDAPPQAKVDRVIWKCQDAILLLLLTMNS